MSRHIAFFNIPAVGHVYPTLAVVSELVARGHRVSYACARERAAALEQSGATVVEYESTRPGDADPGYRAPVGDEYVAGTMLDFLTEAEHTLPQLESAFRTDRPDLVVFDRMAFAGSAFAQRHGIPAIQLWPMLISGPHWSWVRPGDLAHPTMGVYAVRLGMFLTDQGLPIPAESFLAPPVVAQLAFYPRSFQPHGSELGEEYHFVGPCLGPRAESRQQWTPRPDALLISMGTQGNLLPEFYRHCVESFAGSDWHVILVVGKRFDPAELGVIPPNVEVFSSAPQVEILSRAKAFVSHAGMGGVMESLMAGVPHVAVPGTREQQANADRLEALGLGVHLKDPARLREAVDAVAVDHAMRVRIAAMRQEAVAAGGAARAADVIEAAIEPLWLR